MHATHTQLTRTQGQQLINKLREEGEIKENLEGTEAGRSGWLLTYLMD
jgi:hypothetical protein